MYIWLREFYETRRTDYKDVIMKGLREYSRPPPSERVIYFLLKKENNSA